MMTLLSLAGGVLGRFSLPILFAISLWTAHGWWVERDERIRIASKNICDANWEKAIRTQERDAATRAARAAQELLEGERSINERLKNDLETARSEAEAARAASTGDDSRCLSDSVLRYLEGPGKPHSRAPLNLRRTGGGGSKAGTAGVNVNDANQATGRAAAPR